MSAIKVGTLAVALLVAVPSPATNAEETLGRLFFTPEYRQNLDRQRQMNVQNVQQANEDPTLTINGMVTRSSGKRTAWVNGIAYTESEMHSGISVAPRKRSAGEIVIRAEGVPPADLRVGETLNKHSGQTRSLLKEGRIVPLSGSR